MKKLYNPTIAILDSGIGGVAVLKKLINRFKAGKYIYFADNLYMPYGNKDLEFVKTRVEENIKILSEKYKADLIIVACNTASTCIEPKNNVLTLKFNQADTYLTTVLTSKNLNNVKTIPLKDFPNIIEEHLGEVGYLEEYIKDSVKPLIDSNKVVLGCTHFELIHDLFQHALDMEVLDNSDNLIKDLNVETNENLSIEVITTKQNKSYIDKVWQIIKSNKPFVFG